MILGVSGPNGAAGFASHTVNGTTYRAGGAEGVGGSSASFTSQVSEGNHTGEANSFNANNGVSNDATWAYNPQSGGTLDVNGQSYTLPARPTC